jgi:hypothetical protein
VSRSRAQYEIVYLLAGCEARRAQLRDHVRAYLEGADFDGLTRALAERRLLPLIGTRAIEAAPDLVPDSFREAVTAARSAARARGLAVEAATRSLAAALADAGIRALPLKGPLLAAEAHGDIGLRETADVDLMVAPERLDAAIEVLRARGYSEPQGPRRPNGLPDLHFELDHPTLPPVELHWRAYWYERAFSDRMLADARPGPDGVLRAQPDDLAASLLLVHARDGFHGVRVPSDLAAWWDRNGHDLNGAFLERHATEYPELAPGLSASAQVVERLTGVPAVRWLGRGAVGGRRVAMAVRLADWDQASDRDELKANMSLVGALIAPPGALPEFARRELGRPEGARATAAHAVKRCGRFAIAAWKVRGERRWTEVPAGVPPAPGAPCAA